MKSETSTWAILAIIFAFLFPILGLIFGIVAYMQIKKNPKLGGRSLAIAAIIIGVILNIIIPIVVIGILLFYYGAFTPKSYLPEICEISDDVVCEEWNVKTNGIAHLTLGNYYANDLTKGNLRIEQDYCIPRNFDIPSYGDITLTCTVGGGIRGKTFRKPIEMVYEVDGLEAKNYGRIITVYR